MPTIPETLIQTLLRMPESQLLDFKREHYVNDQKWKLVKAIIAFANAWRNDDAYIVIGVDENPGDRATVVGVAKHVDDAEVQQLVNGKTNVHVVFECVAVTVDEKLVDVIRIKKDQRRPIHLTRPFGELKSNAVYIRRGSSTTEATPTELFDMGAAAATARETPALEVELAVPEGRERLGNAATLTSRLLAERPPPDPALRDLRERVLGKYTLAHVHTVQHVELVANRGLRADPAKMAAYLKELGLLQRLGFCIKNTGQVLVKDVQLVLEVPSRDGLKVVDELPRKPRPASELFVGPHAYAQPAQDTHVAYRGTTYEVVARFGKIQPDATVWSDQFWIGSTEPLDLSLVARVYGDNIPKALEVPVKITIAVERGYLEEDDG